MKDKKKILLAAGVVLVAVLLAGAFSLWARVHRAGSVEMMIREEMAVKQLMTEYGLSESEARHYVEFAEELINWGEE